MTIVALPSASYAIACLKRHGALAIESGQISPLDFDREVWAFIFSEACRARPTLMAELDLGFTTGRVQ